MINQFDFKIKELENMKKYPKELYYTGNIELLKRKKSLYRRYKKTFKLYKRVYI